MVAHSMHAFFGVALGGQIMMMMMIYLFTKVLHPHEDWQLQEPLGIYMNYVTCTGKLCLFLCVGGTSFRLPLVFRLFGLMYFGFLDYWRPKSCRCDVVLLCNSYVTKFRGCHAASIQSQIVRTTIHGASAVG